MFLLSVITLFNSSSDNSNHQNSSSISNSSSSLTSVATTKPSPIYDDFPLTNVMNENGNPGRQCNYCHMLFFGELTTLKYHLDHSCEEYAKIQEQKKQSNQRTIQSTINFTTGNFDKVKNLINII